MRELSDFFNNKLKPKLLRKYEIRIAEHDLIERYFDRLAKLIRQPFTESNFDCLTILRKHFRTTNNPATLSAVKKFIETRDYPELLYERIRFASNLQPNTASVILLLPSTDTISSALYTNSNSDQTSLSPLVTLVDIHTNKQISLTILWLGLVGYMLAQFNDYQPLAFNIAIGIYESIKQILDITNPRLSILIDRLIQLELLTAVVSQLSKTQPALIRNQTITSCFNIPMLIANYRAQQVYPLIAKLLRSSSLLHASVSSAQQFEIVSFMPVFSQVRTTIYAKLFNLLENREHTLPYHNPLILEDENTIKQFPFIQQPYLQTVELHKLDVK